MRFRNGDGSRKSRRSLNPFNSNFFKRTWRKRSPATQSLFSSSIESTLRIEPLEDRRLLTIHVWQGPAAGGVWSNAANWTNGALAANDTVQFSSNGGVSSTDDIAGLVLNEVHFTVGGNTILGPGGGVTLGIAGIGDDLVNDTGTNTIDRSLPIVTSAGTMYVVTTAGQLNLNSVISGPEPLELRPGSANGTLQLGEGLGADLSNTYAGDTFVDDGTLVLNKAGAAVQAIPHNLIVGDGSGAANSAVVRENAVNEIDTGATVTVNSDGLFDTNGNTDQAAHQIGTLTVHSGNVATGIGAVNPTGTMSFDAANATLTVNATGTSGGSVSFNGGASFNFTGINALSFTSNSGTSNLTINNPAGGLFAPAGGITDAGAGVAGNALFDLGGGSGAGDAGVYTPTGAHSGTLTHTEAGPTVQTINFSGLTPVTDTVASGTFAINGTGIASLFGVIDGAAGTTTVTDSTAESMTFANKTVVNINGNNAADTFTVNNPNPGTGLTTLNLKGGTASGDVVNLQATAATVTTNWFADGGSSSPANDAHVNIGNAANSVQGILGPINLLSPAPSSEYNSIVVNNSGDTTGRTVTLSSFVQAGLGEPGTTWGKIHGLAATADINYSYGDTRTLVVDGGAGGNTWNVNATGGAGGVGGPQRTNTINAGNTGDLFNIQANHVGINTAVGINSDNFFNGGSGNDTFSVTGSLAGDTNTTLNINGNAPAFPTLPGDVLTVQAGSVVSPSGPGNGSVTNGVSPVVTSYASIENVTGGPYSLNITTTNFAGIPSGNPDTVKLVLANGGTTLDVFFNGTLEGDYPFADVSAISVTGSSDPDTLLVDNSGGFIDRQISYAGATGFDRLVVTGNPGGTPITAVYTPNLNLPAFSGQLVYTQGVNQESITFTGLSPVESLTPVSLLTIGDDGAASAINIVTGPTSIGIDPFTAATATTYQLNYAGTEELINWRNATSVIFNGAGTAHTITENLPTRVDAGSPNQLTTLSANSGAGNDIFEVFATPANVTSNLTGQGGNDDFTNFFAPAPPFDMTALAGPINIDGGAGGSKFAFSDRSSATPVLAGLTFSVPNYELTSNQWATITYTHLNSFYLETSTGGDTFNVTNTAFGTSYILNGDGGDDTFTIGNTTTAYAAGPGTGTLSGILGAVTVLPDDANVPPPPTTEGTADTINVDASNDLGLAGTAHITTAVPTFSQAILNSTSSTFTVPVTQLQNFALVPINYATGDYTYSSIGPVLGSRLEFLNVRASKGADTIDVDDTTATNTTTVQGLGGNDTFNISGDNLSANNDFQGDDNGGVSTPGNDTFFLNVAANIGASAVYFPTASLSIEGDGTATGNTDTDRNQLIVNDNSGTARSLNFQYTDPTKTSGNLDIAPTFAGSGLGGAVSNIPVNVLTMQTVIVNAAANNDTDQITGTTANDQLTVAELPTTTVLGGDDPLRLPNGTLAGSSVTAFLDGTPYLNAPPATIANSAPGIAGGGSGPDLLINGISNFFGLTLFGGGSSGAANTGDQAIVYGASENPLATSANANPFGLGAGVLQAGFGPGGAYDTINASDAGVTMTNSGIGGGSLVPVNLNTGDFAQGGPAFAAQQPGFIVDGGDEATPANPPFLPGGVADNFFVTPSTNFNIQVNGNLPDLTTVNGVPQGDQLNLSFPGSIDVFSDGASPPNVTVTGQTSNASSPFGVKYSSIERVNMTPGNGIVNIIGDNNVVGNNQDDYFKVRGGIDPFTSPTPLNGMNQFSLRIGGSWNPATGDVGTPAPSGGLSAPIEFFGVTRINASGGAATGFDVHGNAIPDTVDAAGVNALDITPYANNTPQGWGIETYYNQGNPNLADGGTPNPDLLIFNGVLGVSENITITPSASQAGQVSDNNAATNTPIAVVNYTNNTNIIVNGSSPAGTAGDTDNLFLLGTDPANPGTSGNDTFDVDLTRAGTPGNELVRVTDGANPLFNIQSFSNFNTLNINTLGGLDSVTVVGRNDGSVTINVTGGDSVSDTVFVPGVTGASDLFQVANGTGGTTNVFATRAGALKFTAINLKKIGHLDINGGGGSGNDLVEVFGTPGNDAFTVTPADALDGTVALAGYPFIGYAALGSGAGGGNSTVDLIGDPNLTGQTDTVKVAGTAAADTYTYTPTATESGFLGLATGGNSVNFDLFGISGLSVDAGAPGTLPGDALVVTTTNAVITPGATNGSGTVAPVDANGQPLLGLSYQDFESATVSGGTLVVDATANNDTVTVDDTTGIVTVLNRSTGATNTYAPGASTGLVIDVSGDNGQVVVINPGLAYSAGGIQVFGDNDGTGNTTLSYAGDAANLVNVNIDANTVKEGAANALVTYTGVSAVNVSSLNALGVWFSGISGIESLAITPTGANTATVVANSTGPVYNVTAPTVVPNFTGTQNSLVINAATPGVLFQANNAQVGVTGLILATYTPSEFANFTINGLGGNNQLTVDSTGTSLGGPAVPSIIFNGGNGNNNSLVLKDTSGIPAISDTYSPGPGTGQGTDTLVLAGGTQTVHFNQLTPVFDSVAGPVTVDGTNGNDAITYSEGNDPTNTPNTAWGQVSVNNLEAFNFTAKTTLTIDTLGGSDAVNLNNPNTPTGLTGINVNGTDPAGNVTLTAHTVPGVQNAMTITPTGTAAGTLANLFQPQPLVTFTDAAHLQIVANTTDFNQQLVYTGTAGNDTFELTPGATSDSGTIIGSEAGPAGFSFIPVGFSGFNGTTGATSGIVLGSGFTVGTGGGTDTAIIDGTSGNDSFSIVQSPLYANAAAVVETVGGTQRPEVIVDPTLGVSHVILRGLGGNDAVSAVMPTVEPTITYSIQGNGPSGATTLDYTAQAGVATTVDLAAGTISGAGANPVNFTGLTTLNLHANGSIVTVVDSASNNTLAVSPTGATAATVTESGVATLLNVTNTSGAANALTASFTGAGDTLAVAGTAGPDVFTADGSHVQITGLQNVAYIGTVTALDLAGGTGSDSFTVTPSAIPVSVDGGDPVGVLPGDTLSLTVPAGAGATTFAPGPSSDSGGFSFAGAGFAAVSFVHIESVTNVNVAASGGALTIDGTNGEDSITIIGTGPNALTASVNGGPTVAYAGVTNLTVNGLAGDDDITVTSPGAGWGITTFNVIGGASTLGDNLLINGTAGLDTIAYAPNAADGGTVTIDGQAIAIASTENLAINGQGGDDSFTVNETGSTITTYTPGNAIDAGTIAVTTNTLPAVILLPVSYSNLGWADQPVTIDAGGAGSDLIFNGTGGNDSFTVTGLTGPTRGQIALETNFNPASNTGLVQLPVQTNANISLLILNGLAGDNTYSVTATAANPLPYTTTLVNGSGLSDPDVVNLNGDGTPVTVNMGTATPTVVGGGLGTVDISGVGTVNLNDLGGTITVDGTATADSFVVTPSTASSAAIQANGLAPVVNATTTGTLNLDPLGGNNAVTVNGTTTSDTITTAFGATTTVTVNALLPIHLNSADTQSLVLNGGAGNDTYAFTGNAGGPGSVTVTGGSGQNTITLPSVAGGENYSVIPGSNSSSGTTFYGASPVISFTGVQNIGITGSGGAAADALNMEGTGGNDTFNLNGGVAGAGTAQVNGGPFVSFGSFGTNSSIDLGSIGINGGADTFNVSQPVGWNIANVVAFGGAPGTGGTFNLSSKGAADAFAYTSTAPQAGTVGLTSGTLTTYTLGNIANLHVNDTAAGNAASLTVTNANAVITPSTTPGTGTVTTTDVGNTTALLPLTYSNIFGTVKATGTSVVINAPDVGDVVTVSAAGVVSVKNPLGVTNSVDVSGYANLVLDLLGSNDTVTFAADSALFANGVNIVGGGSGYTVTAPTGAASTLDLSNNSVTGIVGGSVTLSGIGHLVLNGAGATAVTVNNYGAASTLATAALNGDASINLNTAGSGHTVDFTPLSPTAATIALAGGGPTLNIAGFTGGPGNLVLTSTGANTLDEFGSGGSDSITVTQPTATVTRIAQSSPGAWVPVDLSGFTDVNLNGNAGSDSFTITPSTTVPISVDGGDPVGVLPGDTLNIVPGASAVTYFAGPTSDSGGFIVGADAPVSFTHIESIGPIAGAGALAGPFTIQGTNGDDDIQVTATGTNSFSFSVNGPTVQVTGEPVLLINTMAGDDEVNITGAALGGPVWNETIAVGGATLAAGSGNIDVLSFNTPNGGTLAYTPFSADAGTLAYTAVDATTIFIGGGLVPGTTGGAEQLTLNGQSQGDLFTVNAPNGATTIYTPGATTDAGTLAVGSLLPISFTNLGATGNVTVAGAAGAGTNTLVANGTAGNDTFSVVPVNAALGVVFLNSQVPIITNGIQTLTLNGLAGDNTYNINPGPTYTTINVNGSGQVDPDVLNLFGDGASPVAANIGGPTSSIVGGGLGTVDVSGVGVVNLSDLGAAATINGTAAGPDTFAVTPTGANTATIVANAVAPTLNLTATSLTIADTNGSGGNKVVVNGTVATDTIGVVRGATTTVSVNNGTALLPVNVTTADTSALTVASGTGTDTINVSGAAGPAIFTVLGGQTPASATLNVTNTAAGTTTVTPGATNDSGTVANADGTINFGGVKAVKVTGTGADTLTVRGTNGNDAITSQSLGGNDIAWVNAQAPITFAGFSTLNLNGCFGNDSYAVTPAGATGLAGVTTVNINGTTGANDQVTVNGSTGADAIGFNPAATPGSGNVTITGAATVNLVNIAGLAINGQGGGDALTVTTQAGFDQVTLTPGNAVDSGTVAITSVLNPVSDIPLSYSNLAAGGSLTFKDGSGGAVDTLVYSGTAANDAFTVDSATGTVHLNSQIPVLTPGILVLTLNGLAGDNTYTVGAVTPYTAININGSGLADPDVVTLNGSGAAAAIATLNGNNTATVTGGGLGTVNIVGVGTLNLNNGAGAATVADAGANNTLVVTPTSATTSSSKISGQVPVVNTTSAGNLAVNFTKSNDQLVVNASQYNDTLGVNGALATVSDTETTGPLTTLQTIAYTGPASLTVNGNDGSDIFNVTPSATVPIFVDGGNPVAVQPGDVFNFFPGGGGVTFFPGPTADSGGFQNGANATVSFVHIETVGAIVMPPVGPGPFLITGTNGDDDIQVTATGLNSFSFSVNTGPTISVVGAPNLFIDTLAGDDEVNVTGPTAAMGAWDENISVAGVTHAAGSGNIDVFSFNTPSVGALAYTPGTPASPSGDDNGTLTYTQAGNNTTTIKIGPFQIPNFVPNPTPPFVPPFLTYFSSLGGMNQLTVNGEGQNDPLTVAGLGTTVVATPGATPDAGMLAVGGTLPIGYTNLGLAPTAPITVTGALTLVDNGTAGNDTFTVAGTGATAGQVTLNNQLPIQATGATNLVLNGLQGDNTYNIHAGSTYPKITVSGSGQSDPDVLNFIGDNLNPVTVNLSADTIQEAGDALVSYLGVGQVNITAGIAQGVAFVGTTASDHLVITPTGLNTATVQDNGAAPLYNIVSAAALGDFRTGTNDTLAVDGSSSSHTFTVTNTTITVTGDLPIVYTPAILASLNINGQDSNNSLVVDSGPAGPVTTPIVYNGGAGNHNSLTLQDTGLTHLALSDTYTPGPGTGQGTSILNFGVNPINGAPIVETVHFNQLSPVTDTVAGPLTVVGSNGNDAITAAADPAVVGNGLVSVNNLETVSFLNKTSLTLNGQSGNDTFNISPVGIQTGSAVMTGIAVNGSAGANDQVTVNGTTGADTFNYSPSITLGSGTVQVDTAATVAPIAMTNIAGLAINGQGAGGGGDALTVTTLAGADQVTLTPGSAIDSGSVSITSLISPASAIPLSFSNLDVGGTVTFANAGATPRQDTLVYNGTSGNDTFTVDSATGTVHLNNQIPVLTPGESALKLAGLGGVDTFNVFGNEPFPVSVQGTDNKGGSVLNFTDDGTAAVKVDLAASTITEVGAGFFPVSFAGVTQLNVAAAGQGVTVTGYGAPSGLTNVKIDSAATIGVTTATGVTSTIDYTPQSGTAATITRVEGGPSISITTFNNTDGNLKLDNGGTVLGVNFIGSTGNDAITVAHLAAGASATHVVDVAGGVVGATGVVAGGFKWVPIDIGTAPSTLASLSVLGGAGDDSLVVDDSAGAVAMTGGVFFDGGSGNNKLVLLGTTAETADIYTPGPGTGQGTDTMTVGGIAQKVSFANLAPVYDFVAGPLVVNGTNGDDAINYIEGNDPTNTPNVAWGQVSVNALEAMNFTAKTTLTINAIAGSDTVNLNNPNTPTGLSTTVATPGITVNGGDPTTGSDTLVANGTAAKDLINYKPTSPNAGSITGAGPVTIAFTTVENVAINGQGGGDVLTYTSPANAFGSALQYTPGATPDAGTITGSQIGGTPLVPLAFTNLGVAGSVAFATANAGASDTLTVNGTTASDIFNVTGATGTVQIVTPGGLPTTVPITTAAVSNLILQGLDGDDVFNLTGTLPYATTLVDGGNPSASDTVVLSTAAAAAPIVVTVANATASPPTLTTVTGYGGTVSLTGIEKANLNATGAGSTLKVNGTPNDDKFTYQPTSATGGNLSLAGLNTAFSFTLPAPVVPAVPFTIAGNGSNGGDEVDVQAPNSFATLVADEVNRVVRTSNALGTALMPVNLATDVQVAGLLGGVGNNTFLVAPAPGVLVAGKTDVVGAATFQVPNNLLVNIVGNGAASQNALIVAGYTPATDSSSTLPAALFAVVNRTSNTEGVVRVFHSNGGLGTEPNQFPDISYTGVSVVNAETTTNPVNHTQQTLTLGPDLYDPNGSLNNAAYLGTGAAINATNLAIFPNAFEHKFLQAEQDWYRVVAQSTGTMDFDVYFNQYAGFLPGSGQLQIQVYDAQGNLITGFGVNDQTTDERRRIPVVAGETYYLQVYGVSQDPTKFPTNPAAPDVFDPANATVNGYSISIVNTPAPVPNGIGLNNIVAQSTINAVGTATTFTANLNDNPQTPPTQPLPNLSANDGFYVGKYLVFTSGLLIGQTQLITAYTAATHSFTVASAFGGVPAVGDKFQIESNDTGRSQFDNVTRDNTPTIYIRLDPAFNLGSNPANSLADLQGGGSAPGLPPNSQVITIPFWSGSAANPPLSPANFGSYRVAVFDETNPLSPIFLGYATPVTTVLGQTGVFEFDDTVPLAEGSHTIGAKVEIDSPSFKDNPHGPATVPPGLPAETPFKDLSPAATFQLIIDTISPPVFFGPANAPLTAAPLGSSQGLDPGSDSGIPGDPAQVSTLNDLNTNVTNPTFYGAAEANDIIKVYDDVNGNGVVDNGDVFLGQTTATPLDGTNQDPNGQWRLTSTVNLNDTKVTTIGGAPFSFPFDGTRTILVTAEDPAGNVSTITPHQILRIFLDTQGPQISNIAITGSPGFNLFALKPSDAPAPPVASPTPPVNALTISVTDNPNRDTLDFGTGLGGNTVAIAADLAGEAGTYVLTGENTGVVAIASVVVTENPVVNGQPATATIQLNFNSPLPDDRYTLSINDKNIIDLAGNQLSGFTNAFQPNGLPTFPSSNTSLTFLAAFTVNSHAHIATVASGSVAVDLNGNGVFDPNNSDAVNRDATFTLGFTTDTVFSGNFGPNTNPANVPEGFSKLAAYGQNNGVWRWLFDNKLGTGTVAVPQPTPINGMPVAGNWNNIAGGADQVGLFDGAGTWYLDRAGAGFISAADLANPIATLHGDMKGLPIVGNFDGSGLTSLATYQDGIFYFDLAFDDPGHILTGNFNRTINVGGLNANQNPLANNIGFAVADVQTRPVAGALTAAVDATGHPITDIGLFVPGREESAPSAGTNPIEWYWLISGTPVPGEVTGLNHAYDPTPLGHDLFFQYGNQASLPVVGLFDPPPVAGAIPTPTPTPSPTPSPTAPGGWVANTYTDVLGRTPTASELTYWQGAINNGETPQQVAQGFIESTERLNTLIGNLYTQYLGRTADAQGLQYWTSVWVANGGPEKVQAGIIGSPEYFQTAAGLHPGMTADAAWVTALYNNILGRDPDQGGMDYWTSFLQTNGDSSATKQNVVLGFVTSDEYRITLINGWFQLYLGRTLDASGQQYWLDQMKAGVGQDAIQEGIIGSPEYRAKVGS